MTTWWLSFCDANKPDGKQFIGACIVSGTDFINAVENSHAKGCNPGGEVAGREMPAHLVMMVPTKMRDTLLNIEQIGKIQKLLAPS
jgi:hypothetical protein